MTEKEIVLETIRALPDAKNIQQQFQGMLSVAVENLLKGAGATVAESYRAKIGGPAIWKTTIIFSDPRCSQ